MDEREGIDYETPRLLSDVVAEFPTSRTGLSRCSACGANSQPLADDQLTIIKHHHASQPLGHLRVYCRDHLAASKEWGDYGGGAGSTGKVGPTCPTCNMATPKGTRVCDSCDTVVG